MDHIRNETEEESRHIWASWATCCAGACCLPQGVCVNLRGGSMCFLQKGSFTVKLSLGNTGSRTDDSPRKEYKQYFPITRNPFSHPASIRVIVPQISV